LKSVPYVMDACKQEVEKFLLEGCDYFLFMQYTAGLLRRPFFNIYLNVLLYIVFCLHCRTLFLNYIKKTSKDFKKPRLIYIFCTVVQCNDDYKMSAVFPLILNYMRILNFQVSDS